MGAAMTQRRSQASGQRGFTLVETMIAIAVMTIGIVSLLAVFGTAVTVTEFGQENLIARQKALQAMERHLHGAKHAANHLRADCQHLPRRKIHGWTDPTPGRRSPTGW